MAEQAKILIVDDDEDYRASTRALLEGEGYAVLEAGNGPEGLAAARKHRPNLIILDVMMDGLGDGYSVNQAIKFAPEYRDLGPVPILMASALEMDPANLLGWIGDTSRINPDIYMTKPLDIMMESPVEGYSVIQALKFRNDYSDLGHIPVVMVSSVQQDPATLFPMAGEVDMITPDAYFTKPLDLEPFLQCVRRIVGD